MKIYKKGEIEVEIMHTFRINVFVGGYSRFGFDCKNLMIVNAIFLELAINRLVR